MVAKYNRPIVVLLPVFIAFVCGCANLRLPAIDPSGQRIFLPHSRATTLNTWEGYPQAPRNPSRIGRTLGVPGPLFPSSARPEKCPEDFLAPNQATADAQPRSYSPAPEPAVPRVMVPGCFQDPHGRPYKLCGNQSPPQGRISLSPRRVIAPVGSEVVLVGGVCDRDGYYRTREQVEWALQKGSVGTFTEPGQSGYGIIGTGRFLGSLLAEPLPELLSSDYAVGCTSRKVQVLTRGTPEPNDDIFVQNGQAWIGLTSDREGNSYVTMFAPGLDNQNDRKASSVVHWIDGRWTLPQRKVASPGTTESLTTTVQRQLSGSPISDWIVRYEIVDGAEAKFEDDSLVREVRTDSLGQATVKVIPQGPVSGTTQIKVQIIRPASGRGEPDRMIIGQGFTSISWNNSSLEIRLDGPVDNIPMDGEADYQITVKNTGTIPETGVEVRSMIPAGMQLVSSTPRAQQSGATVIWNLGQLGPGQERIVNVVYRSSTGGTLRHCVTARSDRVEPIEDCISTFVKVRALKIDAVGPSETARLEIGDIANYEIEVTNTGDRRLTDILVSDRFDDGLRFRTSDDPTAEERPSPISRTIASLEPGETNRFELNFAVAAPGRHCHTLEATAEGSEPARLTACVQGVEPLESRLEVQATGPTQMNVGEQKIFYILLENTGDTPVSNIQVTYDYDNSLVPTGSLPQANVGANGAAPVTWNLDEPIRPGERQTLQLQFLAEQQVGSTTVNVLVRAAGGIEESDGFELSILPRATDGRAIDDDGMDRFDDTRGGREFDSEADGIGLDDGLGSDNDFRRGRDAGLGDDLSRDGGIGNFEDAEAENFVNLELEIEPRQERLGNDVFVDYLFIITNNDDIFESRVQLDVSLPTNVKFVSFRGPDENANFSADERRILMRPIETIRDNEQIKYEVRVRVLRPGETIVRGEITSLRNPKAIVKESRMVVRN